MSDSINMRLLTPDTYGAIQVISTAREWAEIQGRMEPEQVAWLAVRLAFVPECEFARGKWATIQRIQQLLSDCAEKESKP